MGKKIVNLLLQYDTVDKNKKWFILKSMYNWQKFEKTNVRQESRITITKSNSFGFPTKFFQDNNIGNYTHVVLFFDQNEQVIGIHFTNDEGEKHKFSILKSKQGHGASVVATSFFKTYNLDSGKLHGRYEWQKDNPEGIGELFVIKLVPRAEIPMASLNQTG